MSFLTDNPDLMMEALAVMVRRAGGSVTITAEEAPGPFNLLSKYAPGHLHLVLEENLSDEQIASIKRESGTA